MRNHVKTAHTRHRDIADYQFIVRSRQALKRLFSRARRSAVVLAVEEIRQDRRNLRLVINDQNPCLHVGWHFSDSYFRGHSRQLRRVVVLPGKSLGLEGLRLVYEALSQPSGKAFRFYRFCPAVANMFLHGRNCLTHKATRPFLRGVTGRVRRYGGYLTGKGKSILLAGEFFVGPRVAVYWCRRSDSNRHVLANARF